MARAISIEMGAPIDFARGSQAACLPWHTKNFLKAFDGIEWVRRLGPHAPNDRIAMEAIGVAGLITPWNWPMNQVSNACFATDFAFVLQLILLWPMALSRSLLKSSRRCWRAALAC